MDVQQKNDKWVIIHSGKTIKEKFATENEAYKWADANIDDQVFDDPNSFLPPLVYDDESKTCPNQ